MSSAGARVLVVDDERPILRVVSSNLERRGFQTDTAATGAEALDAYRRHKPDVVVLDLGLPDMDGVEIIRAIREAAATPVIVLSAREAERDKVEALDAGADDYVSKPFGIEELLARIRVALRHTAGSGAEPVFTAGGLTVDFERRRVEVAGAEVHLTPTEYELLKVFIARRDRVLTDRMLLQAVWGPEYGSEDHYLHVYVARLRKKIEPDPTSPRLLITEPGAGYRFVTPDAAR
ncbi:MAG: response regulator transcription factor [Dehalococcoidia bacterium]